MATTEKKKLAEELAAATGQDQKVSEEKSAQVEGMSTDQTDPAEGEQLQDEQSQDDAQGQEVDQAEDDTAEDETGIDWKAESRKHERRAKKAQSNYDAIAAELEQVRAKYQALQESQQLAELKRTIAQEFRLPEDLIAGADEEEMRAFAQRLAEYTNPSSAPKVSAAGKFANNAGEISGKQKLAQQMFSQTN